MKYGINRALARFSENSHLTIGDYKVKKDGNFLTFSPSVHYKGRKINRIKISESTFKHFGEYTVDLLFGKLIPSINDLSYEETLHPDYESQPSAHILSTTADDVFSNYDSDKNKTYPENKQYRSHNVRVCEDEYGFYIEWPHLSPIRNEKYFSDLPNQSRESKNNENT